ncbi:MAG: SDR family oxidoreductase [Bacteroidia bacterium]|nr:SDR family oxidoreductase [Bacteroidia bacterium]MDW8302132.1 SDR family oxidoreductase [Bacteroidia bacterium]
MQPLDLGGKTALVCGATQGIGSATAFLLSSLGANIVLMARNEVKLKQKLSELCQSNTQHHEYLVADFTNPEQVRTVIQEYTQSKIIHIVVNNTGGPPAGEIENAAIEDFRVAFEQHLICNHIIAQAVLPKMKEIGFGRIINIISTSVKQPIKGLGVSNTIRAAVANWAKTLSNEVAKYGITVNNVLPGATYTERLQSLIEVKAQKTNQTQEQVTETMLHEIPMHRFAKPEEIAYAVAFLASPWASYITGINLPVDGGRTGCL